AVQAGGPLTLLAVIAVLNAAAAAFYYLRVVVYMFMRAPATETPALAHGALLWSGLAAATVMTILFGVFPTTLLDIVSAAANAITTLPGCRAGAAGGQARSLRARADSRPPTSCGERTIRSARAMRSAG